LGRRTVIGQGTSIGDKTTVKNTVLGRNCKIGKNVTLEGAYIWDNVVIGDGTTVRQAIIADGVVLGNKCAVEPGSLLSFGVKIADSVTVSEGRRITKAPREEDGESPAYDSEIVGADGEGYEYVPYDDEDDDETASNASSGLSMHPSLPRPTSNPNQKITNCCYSLQYGQPLSVHRLNLYAVFRDIRLRRLALR
jgi:translation initiation factor eIF-2B subunit epsilon